MEQFHNALDLIRSKQPNDPVFCVRPYAAERAAKWFNQNFPGKVFYAVKANPATWLLDALTGGGISHFDVASISEARMIRNRYPDATLGFMNPVKSNSAIAEAYHDLGVRIFALDSENELMKIVTSTGHAADLTLCVRLKVPNRHATIPLSSKFGVDKEGSASLLQHARQYADNLGICFHVGSQAMSPLAYGLALDHVQNAIADAGVIVDIINVGGGFPAPYPGLIPPPITLFINEISSRFESLLTTHDAELWCEPGRALAAESASLVVRVEGRKGNCLYINDGIYGALYDAGALEWSYPVSLLKLKPVHAPLTPFSFYGPTCDDADYMRGPFMLPEHICDGDYVEVGMLGAYGAAMCSGFNGFNTHEEVIVRDEQPFIMFPEIMELAAPAPSQGEIK